VLRLPPHRPPAPGPAGGHTDDQQTIRDAVLAHCSRFPVKRKTDGLSLFFTDLDRAKIEVREIPKMGRHAVDSNLVYARQRWAQLAANLMTMNAATRYLREVLIPRTAPVSPHMILNFLAEKVLGLPKSY
jgi:hypothetical protein